MTIRTLMLDLTDRDALAPLLALGLPLAARHGATLLGVHVAPPLEADGQAAMTDILYTQIVEEQRAREEETASALAASFDAALEREGASGGLMRVEPAAGGVSAALARVCRNADLVLARVPDAETPHLTSPGTLALDCGRPVLAVPAGCAADAAPGRRVLVAWNGSREAARAAFDALPLLAPGAEIRVMAVDAGQVAPGGGFQPGDTLARTLARHGHRVEATTRKASSGTVGAELLTAASEWGADLLVMGCYGHSRLQEWVLGGATRSILQRTTLPVLLSH